MLSDSIITFQLNKFDANKEISNTALVSATTGDGHGKEIACPPTKEQVEQGRPLGCAG